MIKEGTFPIKLESAETPQDRALRLLKDDYAAVTRINREKIGYDDPVPRQVYQRFLETMAFYGLQKKDGRGLLWAETITIRNIVEQF